MPKLPRLTAIEAEKLLIDMGFMLIRTKGSHKVYKRKGDRFILPFHAGKNLHPKIVKDLFEIINSKKS